MRQVHQVSSDNTATCQLCPPILSQPAHTQPPNSSRNFGAIVVIVIGASFLVYSALPYFLPERGIHSSFVEQLRDWTRLLLHLDLAKAKVR